jgi:hypothetical protein
MANRFIVLFGEEDKIKIQRNLFFEKNQGMNGSVKKVMKTTN